MGKDILIKNAEFREWIVSIRRHIHSYPELGYKEKRTSEYISSTLKELGIKVRSGMAKTGVVGLLGDPNWPVVAFRADMDGLPIQENDTIHNKTYKSRHEGTMHACGHDAHVAILLGIAKWLVNNPRILDDVQISVKFLFQPAEEGGAGAVRMIKDGALENPIPRVLLAAHMYPELEVGHCGIFEGQGYAYVDKFTIRFTGKGGHASRPHLCHDPIVAACYFVTELQTVISRSIDPMDPAVVTIGKISGGKAPNVIPELVELEGTVRALSSNARDLVWKRIKDFSESVTNGFEVQCEPIFSEWYPPCVNDTTLVHFLHGVCLELLGKKKVHFLKPVLGAEDFAFYGPIVPSAIFRLGCANKGKGICWDSQSNSLIGLHSPSFDIDEDVLLIGVSIFVKAIQMAPKLAYLKSW